MPAFTYLGFTHIVNIGALDHILFLLALSAIYRPRDWRRALWVISAFTVGHSITLVLAVTGAVRLDAALIEFLIPVTIVLTCVENIALQNQPAPVPGRSYRPILAGAFGLVHGAGFANYLRDLFENDIALPLLGFNVGIELGQIVVLVMAAAGLALIDLLIQAIRRNDAMITLRIRMIAVSAIVMVVATRWAIERNPW